MKIATWNVNSLKVRLEQVLAWLDEFQPDVLALQEIKCETQNFPFESFLAKGYQATASGQKTYNGVAILAKKNIENIVTDIETLADPQRRILAATIADVRIINLYVPNGEAILSEKYSYKLNWLKHLSEFISEQLTLFPKLIVLGDFNIAPEDKDVHDPDLWRGQVLCSEPERKSFQDWISFGLKDSFRLFSQPEKIFSWWDYRNLGLQKNHGLRIDHILISEALVPFASQCIIDKSARKKTRPSDHAPVLLTLDID